MAVGESDVDGEELAEGEAVALREPYGTPPQPSKKRLQESSRLHHPAAPPKAVLSYSCPSSQAVTNVVVHSNSSQGVLDGTALPVAARLADADVDSERVALGEAGNTEGEMDALGEPVGDAAADAVSEALALLDGETTGGAVAVATSDSLWEERGEGEVDGEDVDDVEGDAERLGSGERLWAAGGAPACCSEPVERVVHEGEDDGEVLGCSKEGVEVAFPVSSSCRWRGGLGKAAGARAGDCGAPKRRAISAAAG